MIEFRDTCEWLQAFSGTLIPPDFCRYDDKKEERERERKKEKDRVELERLFANKISQDSRWRKQETGTVEFFINRFKRGT